jgi:hypothetical protein
VATKLLALALGKVIAMIRSHGSVLQVLSRSAQHELGAVVHSKGWDSQVLLSPNAIHELSLLKSALVTFNGQNIFISVRRKSCRIMSPMENMCICIM